MFFNDTATTEIYTLSLHDALPISKRWSFKIDFNEYDDDLKFRGLTKVNLNNNSTDPSLMREPLSYELFREAGIHCSRVGYAKVSLTIPGKIDRRPHGLYTVIEQVDKRFLKEIGRAHV